MKEVYKSQNVLKHLCLSLFPFYFIFNFFLPLSNVSIHLRPLQCQAAWESLVTLLQDKQTEDKTSETN